MTDGCQGIVGVRFTSGSRTVASKRVRLKSGHCSYSLRVRAVPPAGKSKLRVRVHFYGNAILTPQRRAFATSSASSRPTPGTEDSPGADAAPGPSYSLTT